MQLTVPCLATVDERQVPYHCETSKQPGKQNGPRGPIRVKPDAGKVRQAAVPGASSLAATKQPRCNCVLSAAEVNLYEGRRSWCVASPPQSAEHWLTAGRAGQL